MKTRKTEPRYVLLTAQESTELMNLATKALPLPIIPGSTGMALDRQNPRARWAVNLVAMPDLRKLKLATLRNGRP